MMDVYGTVMRRTHWEHLITVGSNQRGDTAREEDIAQTDGLEVSDRGIGQKYRTERDRTEVSDRMNVPKYRAE